MNRSKLLSCIALAAVITAGPLAPLSASAQTQSGPTMETAPPPPPIAPPLAPAPIAPAPIAPAPVESGTVVQPVPPPPLSGPVQMRYPMSVEPTRGDAVAAGFMNVIYVPGKAILCGAGSVLATAMMLITFGTGYQTSQGIFREGCLGTWVLTADHVSGRIPPDWVLTDNYQAYFPQAQGVYP